MARKDRPLVLWPLYFDSRRTREEGRRVPKRLAVEAPTVEEIATAADALGLQPSIEKKAAHPSMPWRRDGRVLLGNTEYAKTSVVLRVAERLKAQRS
jgi:signal recognition particle subunit SRP19